LRRPGGEDKGGKLPETEKSRPGRGEREGVAWRQKKKKKKKTTRKKKKTLAEKVLWGEKGGLKVDYNQKIY